MTKLANLLHKTDGQSTQEMANFACTIPVRHEVDVFVAGGGPAGSSAALAAARMGASVFIAEGELCFGGMGTSGGLPMLCQFGDGVDFHAEGIGREIHDRLIAANGCIEHPLRKPGDLYFEPEALKVVFDNLITAESLITPSLHTRVIGVDAQDGVVRMLICQGKSGLFGVRARCVVDASGDGDICAWAGAPFSKGDDLGRMQPGTLVSMWSGIDWDKANAAEHGLWHQSKFLKQAIEDGIFSCPDPGMPGIVPTGPDCGNGNIGHLFGIDGTDERSLTKHAIDARRRMGEYAQYFRSYLTGYERLHLGGTAARVGIRETRRITGDYELSIQDFKDRAIFDDEIGRYSYPVDLHPTTLEESDDCEKVFERMRMAPGESYGIPLGILRPQGLHNVMVAGRCVSADRVVLGSLRVQPGCYIMGQAAGVNAALAVSGRVRSVSAAQVQGALHSLGAWLPNYVA